MTIHHKSEDYKLSAVPYQHFTNAIENFFSVFKSRLQKKIGITYQELKSNIKDTIKDIPSEIMLLIFQGSYGSDKNIKENHQEKQKGSQNSIKNNIFIVI